MYSSHALSIAVMLAGIPLLLPALSALLRRKHEKRSFLVAASAVLHLIAVIYSITVDVSASDSTTEKYSPVMLLLSVGIGLLSVFLLLGAVFLEPDGKIRFRSRRSQIPVFMLAGVLLPVLLASAAMQILPDINLITYGFSLSVFLTDMQIRGTLHRRLRDKEADLELQHTRLLSEQIHPHFIFNVLMSIQNLCYQDADAAADCIAQFAGYLRGNMDAQNSEKLIPFETELEHIREYEALEHACTDMPFTLNYSLGVTDFEIPALTVQPVVENALKHGALSRRDGTGRAELKTEQIGKLIRITVSDNGTGDAALTERQKTHRSIGLKNAEDRLAVQCGGTLQVTFGAEGAKAVILIPAKEETGHADDHR